MYVVKVIMGSVTSKSSFLSNNTTVLVNNELQVCTMSLNVYIKKFESGRFRK